MIVCSLFNNASYAFKLSNKPFLTIYLCHNVRVGKKYSQPDVYKTY